MNEDYWCHLKFVNVYLLCDYCGDLICVSWIVVHVVPLMLATVNYTQLQIFYIEQHMKIKVDMNIMKKYFVCLKYINLNYKQIRIEFLIGSQISLSLSEPSKYFTVLL